MVCRTIRLNGGGAAWLADSKGATEWRPNGFKQALRKLRVPLVLQRRIFTLCTKVHAYIARKIPCRRVPAAMSFCPRIMSLRDIRDREQDRFVVCATARSEKKQQHQAPECSIRPRETLNLRIQARKPLIDRRPALGFRSGTKSRGREPECREFRRYINARLNTPSCADICS
jgi:hypothetical protein